MSVEELLKELQDRGMSDDEIKTLLDETLKTLGKDEFDHDKDQDEKEEASKLLGVEL